MEYKVTAHLKAARSHTGVYEIMTREFEMISVATETGIAWIYVSSRSAAKDLVWQLLCHEDVRSVSLD